MGYRDDLERRERYRSAVRKAERQLNAKVVHRQIRPDDEEAQRRYLERAIRRLVGGSLARHGGDDRGSSEFWDETRADVVRQANGLPKCVAGSGFVAVEP